METQDVVVYTLDMCDAQAHIERRAQNDLEADEPQHASRQVPAAEPTANVGTNVRAR
jgi:hypothetical protein